VRAALEGSGFEIAAEVGDARSAVDATAEHRPDVALLDINMPGNGITAAAQISAQFPDTAVVMLTVSQNDDDLFAALRAGAVGYLLKDTDPARLPMALLGVLRGESALPRTLVSRLVEEFRGRGKRRLRVRGARGIELTPREWEVLEGLRDGLSTDELAQQMFVSAVTVRSHVSAILKKLQVPDRASAVKLLED
jgi:DNA-binding NarL/FixJ family response regulator